MRLTLPDVYLLGYVARVAARRQVAKQAWQLTARSAPPSASPLASRCRGVEVSGRRGVGVEAGVQGRAASGQSAATARMRSSCSTERIGKPSMDTDFRPSTPIKGWPTRVIR